MLISFWDQRSKVKVTAGNDPKNGMNTISLPIELFSSKLGHLPTWPCDMLVRSKGKVTQAEV